VHKWFAVQTKPRAERVGCEQLRRQGFTCSLPMTRRELRGVAGMRVLIEPLFPRYLFLRADDDVDDLSRVRSTRGISGLVRFGGLAAVVPEAVLQRIDARAGDDGLIALAAPELAPGDTVRITQGPFTGMDAIFSAARGSDRALLFVHLLGEHCGVVVPRRHLAQHV
jgi:transcriptional antiterminator RfaH